MSLRILTLANIGLLIVASVFTDREPLAGMTVRAITVLVDFVALLQILVQGEFSDFSFTGNEDVDRDTNLLTYILGLLWVVMLGTLCGGLSLLFQFHIY